ncbi:helix-turn-helix domain-containing protein [Kamptonema sp. PCC 6506]|uniref:helix-turn-helix domain-containing protein n=2 Tax=Kamptonema TaxID=1501433 RepID=UPI001F1ED18F|nr:helix-turn-helix transcriptional regulator [Kamptonema sp. PCC 6506]
MSQNVTMISELFRVTIERYGISGKQLSKFSGVSENHISEFRRGKTGISTEVLWKLIEAMDEIKPGARAYFCARLTGGEGFGNGSQMSVPKQLESLLDMQNLVDSLSDDSLALLLMVVAARIKNGVSSHGKGLELIG